MNEKPAFWRTTFEEIEETLGSLRIGTARLLGRSAGNRDIYLAEYGAKEDWNRRANYNSACGAESIAYYKDPSAGTKPVLLLIGGIHGGEFEGIAGLLNLLHVLEKGTDYRGKRWDYLHEQKDRFRLLIIPCMNPDGRARVPFGSVAGMPLADYRYYVQGTWKDGRLCDWPGCKAVHPMKDHVAYLGGYFNDDGVNLMHDNFFLPMADETAALLHLADEEAPDLIVQLHGGTNCRNQLMPTAYVPPSIQAEMLAFDQGLYKECKRRGLRYKPLVPEDFVNETESAPRSFNLASALHHVCGGISMVYESNQSLGYGEADSLDDILDHHLLLVEQMFRYYE